MDLTFTLFRGVYSIYRLKKDSLVPDWVYKSEFYSLTRTHDELSIVCKNTSTRLNEDIKADRNWRILKINGPLDLSLTGIIANVSHLLKEHKISIFIISTYDTDYILVKYRNLDKSLKLLKDNGHRILYEK